MFKKIFISAGRILLPLLMVSNVVFCDKLKIYENLVQCYRGENNTQPWIGNSLQILLELIRKIENSYPTALDIRALSVSLIHRLRIDGIERAPGIHETDYITPYRPIGIMTPKFELLLKLISDVPTIIKFDDILTPFELCTLHKLISSTVEPFKRGDEATTCLISNNQQEWKSSDFIDRTKVKVFKNGQSYVIPGSISKCPIEMGVIRTLQYGSLSPGTLIASIAAGLQPQMVPIKELLPSIDIKSSDSDENYGVFKNQNIDEFIRKLTESYDTIDNMYASGLAGDLAEVCIYQAPYNKQNVTVGLHGYWNDTEYPSIRYLPESYQLEWTMTDAEILAGIDSFHIATHINSWVNRVRRMRLSEIIEMYLSPRGIPTFAIENANRYQKRPTNNYENNEQQQDFSTFNRNEDNGKIMMNHGHRRPPQLTSKLHGIPDDFSGLYRSMYYDPDRYSTIGDDIDSACERKQILNRIPKDRLKEQTYFLAQILQYSTQMMIVNDKLMKSVCNSAVDKFFDYANELLDKLPDCKKIGSNYLRATVDLTLIIDGSRTKYENLKLISYLSEIIDVSVYGSKISVVHGTTGDFMVTPTDSIVNVFDQLRKFKDPYPTTLSLTESFTTILYSLTNRNEQKRQNKQIAGKSKVILVMSQSQKIRQNDFENAKSIIEGSFQSFTDLYFVFVTNDIQTFKEMTKNVQGSSLDTPNMQYNIIDAPNIDLKTFTSSLSHILRSIPNWMRVPDYDELKIPLRKPGDLIEPIEKSIVNNYGNVHEAYISPNEKIFYKIDGRTLSNINKLNIQFESVDYGDITACITKNSKDYQCQSTNVLNPIQFNVTQICNYEKSIININNDDIINDNTVSSSSAFNYDDTTTSAISNEMIKTCPSLIFKIDMDNSKMKCSENDCRYPDQVRFLVRLRKDSATNLVISSVVFIIAILNHIFLVKFMF